MAAETTSIVPISEVQDHIRVHDGWREMEQMDTVGVDPVATLNALTGMSVKSLIYAFPMQGKTVTGITVNGAKALAAQRGHMEVLPPELTRTSMDVELGDGSWVEVPAWQAIVRVRDLRTETTFVGIAVEPAVQVLKDGTQRLNPNAAKVANAKATRNGILDHLTRMEDMIQEFANRARASDSVYVMDGAGEQAEQASRAMNAQQAKRRAMRSAPIGNIGMELIKARVNDTAEEAGVEAAKLGRDLLAFCNQQWPELKLSEIPAADKPQIEAWIADKRRELGLDAPADAPPALPAADGATEPPEQALPAETLFDDEAPADDAPPAKPKSNGRKGSF